jgi:hypothetical protein
METLFSYMTDGQPSDVLPSLLTDMQHPKRPELLEMHVFHEMLVGATVHAVEAQQASAARKMVAWAMSSMDDAGCRAVWLALAARAGIDEVVGDDEQLAASARRHLASIPTIPLLIAVLHPDAVRNLAFGLPCILNSGTEWLPYARALARPLMDALAEGAATRSRSMAAIDRALRLEQTQTEPKALVGLRLMVPDLLVEPQRTTVPSDANNIFQSEKGWGCGSITASDGAQFFRQGELTNQNAVARCSFFKDSGGLFQELDLRVHVPLASVRAAIIYVAFGAMTFEEDHAADVLQLAKAWKVPALVSESTRLLLVRCCNAGRANEARSIDNLLHVMGMDDDDDHPDLRRMDAIATVALAHLPTEVAAGARWIGRRHALTSAMTRVLNKLSTR